MKQKIFALLVLLLVSQLGYADDWLHLAIKVDNPNQLAYLAIPGAQCPVTTKTIKEIVEGVFIRSRIKPTKDWGKPGGIYLNVRLHCLKKSDNYFVSSIAIHFARDSPSPTVLFNRNFGHLGIGANTDITAAIKESVERAITYYIKANFDL